MDRVSSKPLLSLVTVIDAEEDNRDEPKKIKKVNNYILAGKLGCGSFSKVYLGIDSETKKKFAVKRIKLKELCRTTSGIAQLEREVRLMQIFDHPNILKLYEVLHVESMHFAYLILEYAKKGSLGALIDRGVKLSQQVVFSIIKQVISALKYLHNNGFVHQDIKPGNILIDENGRAILADFGIGHSFQSSTMVVGSPAFQAPECLDDSAYDEEEELDEDKNDVDPQKEDVWSLGVTLYQLLFMKLPFEGDNLFEIVQYIKSNDLTFPEGTDPKIIELIRGMLAVDQTSRFDVNDIMQNELIANAAELAVDLPEPPEIEVQEGEFEQINASVCPRGYSFASVAMSIQRRLSFINAPYSPERLQGRSPLQDSNNATNSPPIPPSGSSAMMPQQTAMKRIKPFEAKTNNGNFPQINQNSFYQTQLANTQFRGETGNDSISYSDGYSNDGDEDEQNMNLTRNNVNPPKNEFLDDYANPGNYENGKNEEQNNVNGDEEGNEGMATKNKCVLI